MLLGIMCHSVHPLVCESGDHGCRSFSNFTKYLTSMMHTLDFILLINQLKMMNSKFLLSLTMLLILRED